MRTYLPLRREIYQHLCATFDVAPPHNFRFESTHAADPDSDGVDIQGALGFFARRRQGEPYPSWPLTASDSPEHYGLPVHANVDELENWREWYNKPWVRPGHTGGRLDLAILRTCRRIYIEAREVVIKSYVHVVDTNCGPAKKRLNIHDPTTPYYTNGVSRAQIYPNNRYLETYLFDFIASGAVLRRLQHLRLTIRSIDWNGAISVNPFRIDSGIDSWGNWKRGVMQSDMRTCENFSTRPVALSDQPQDAQNWVPPIEYEPFSWGLTFMYLPQLTSLTIDFEGTEMQKDNIEPIVEWATRTWQFP
ncbi:unnamed protein product [Parascedosporium putredinis]|uniref:Uncharacterized protein n=1 Tax=Parascedosporium putredinis TaxID=1442378 RepID=A0A9P1HA33_9PEZI|nr:unnamed protein product [Parascedosporium putredinis]CAI8001697.1 unnamed protein product [Parascedosporium putredinis]